MQRLIVLFLAIQGKCFEVHWVYIKYSPDPQLHHNYNYRTFLNLRSFNLNS